MKTFYTYNSNRKQFCSFEPKFYQGGQIFPLSKPFLTVSMDTFMKKRINAEKFQILCNQIFHSIPSMDNRNAQA